MSTELKIQVIEGIAPVTLAEAVKIGDGTEKNLADELTEIKSSISSSGGSGSTGTGMDYILSGTVKFKFDITNRIVTWTSGYLYTANSKITITAGTKTFTSGEWNIGNPTYSYLFCYNSTSSTFEWKTIGALSGYTGNPIFAYHYDDKNTSSNDAKLTFHLLNYPQHYVSFLRDITISKRTIPNIKELAILGDSLSSANWVGHWEGKIYVPTINNQAKSGAAMSNQSTGTTNIVNGQVNNVTATTDYCIIFAGTNDSMFGAKIESCVATPTDITSFTQAYQITIEKLITTNPAMKIVLVTPATTIGKDYGSGLVITNDGLKTYADAVKAIGEYYSLPVLDLHRTCNVNKFNTATFQTDGLHFTEVGYKMIADKIFRFICTI